MSPARVLSAEQKCEHPSDFLTSPPSSFSINIGHDPDNLALHFNPRFDYGGDHNTIVFNTLSGGCWGDEHREGNFPFAQGDEAKVGG